MKSLSFATGNAREAKGKNIQKIEIKREGQEIHALKISQKILNMKSSNLTRWPDL